MKKSIQWEGSMPKEQRTFTKEFKLEAVHLVQTSGKSQAHLARDLGIADSTLHHWCKEFSQAGEKAFPGSGNPPAHSDRGSSSTSTGYLSRMAQVGIVVSMSRSGDCYDHAAMESFFSTLKSEWVK